MCKRIKGNPKNTSNFIADSQKIMTQKLDICYFYVQSTNYSLHLVQESSSFLINSRTKYFSFSLKPLNIHHISHENSLPTSCFPRCANWSDSNLKMAATQHFFEAPHQFKNFYCHSKLLFHKQHLSLTPSDHRLLNFFGTLYHLSSHVKCIPHFLNYY